MHSQQTRTIPKQYHFARLQSFFVFFLVAEPELGKMLVIQTGLMTELLARYRVLQLMHVAVIPRYLICIPPVY